MQDAKKALFLATLLVASCATNNITSTAPISINTPSLTYESKFLLYPPTEKKIKFSGAIETQNNQPTSANMLYPADTGGAFAASLLAHAITNSAIRSHQESERVEQANLVLKSYEQAINTFSFAKLTPNKLEHIKSIAGIENIARHGTPLQEPDWGIAASPIFIISQDQQALTLQTKVRIFPIKKPATPIYEREIIYTVFVTPDNSPTEFWLNNDATMLYETGATMYAQVLSIALKDSTGKLRPDKSTERTFRFRKGEKIKYERGVLLSLDCQRLTMLTLRDSIKSMPISPSDYKEIKPEECQKPILSAN